MKEAPGFITGNELIDPGAFVLLHCFFYEYDFRFGHCISIQNFIQLVCLDQIFFQNQLSYNFSGFQRCFRDSCGGFISQIRAEGGCDSGTAFHQGQASFAVCRDSADTIVDQSRDSLLKSADRFEQVIEYDRLESIEFHLTCFSSHCDGCIVTYDMESDLCDDLRNDRIDFSRHDGGAILTCRKVDLAKSCFWTGREKPEIVAHFGEIYGTGLYGTGYGNESVQILCGIKQIICLFQRIAVTFLSFGTML